MKKLKVSVVRLLNVYMKVFPYLFQLLDYGLLQKDWSIGHISATAIAISWFIGATMINHFRQGNTNKKRKRCSHMRDQQDFVRIEVVWVLLSISICILILIPFI